MLSWATSFLPVRWLRRISAGCRGGSSICQARIAYDILASSQEEMTSAAVVHAAALPAVGKEENQEEMLLVAT